MKLLICYKAEAYEGITEETIEIDLNQDKIDLGEFKESLEILEMNDNHIILNIKQGLLAYFINNDFKQYVFKYCPVTIEVELEGGYTALKFELID